MEFDHAMAVECHIFVEPIICLPIAKIYSLALLAISSLYYVTKTNSSMNDLATTLEFDAGALSMKTRVPCRDDIETRYSFLMLSLLQTDRERGRQRERESDRAREGERRGREGGRESLTDRPTNRQTDRQTHLKCDEE